MIVVDTSVLIAILKRESDADALIDHLSSDADYQLSALNLYEARIVLIRADRARQLEELDSLIAQCSIRLAAFDHRQSDLASAAYARYGRGTGHPARLNLADCAAYALATSLDAALLYKGDDFALTDVRPALDR